MNDVIPRPSQPSSRAIKCGIKISMFIDRTNMKTRIVNRLINLSSFM